jgi:hypothetical protein
MDTIVKFENKTEGFPGKKEFRMQIIGDTSGKQTPVLAKIEKFTFLSSNLNLVGKNIDLIFKSPGGNSVLFRMNPDVYTQDNFVVAQVRVFSHPFTGFKEYMV